MELEVEATGVTDGLPLRVASPQRGGVGPAVGADHPRPPVPALQCHKCQPLIIRCHHPLTLLLDTLVLAGGLLTVFPLAPPPVLGLIPFILL